MTPLQPGKWGITLLGPWHCLRDLSRGVLIRWTIHELRNAGGGSVTERRRDGSTLEIRIPGRAGAARCRCAVAPHRPGRRGPGERRQHTVSRACGGRVR